MFEIQIINNVHYDRMYRQRNYAAQVIRKNMKVRNEKELFCTADVDIGYVRVSSLRSTSNATYRQTTCE